MDKESVYIETTIPSYLVSEKSQDVIVLSRQILTEQWWDEQRHKYHLFISDVVFEEISSGNVKYSQQRIEIIQNLEMLQINNEITEIALSYKGHFNLPDGLIRDLFHIAFCVYYNINFLLTWNCTHLANIHFIKQLKKFNEKNKLITPDIITPDLLMD